MNVRLQKDGYWFFFGLCAVISSLPLWVTEYLPMADFPQHAVQLDILRRYFNPATKLKELYELRWFTPYLTGMSVSYLFALFFNVIVALKITLNLTLIAFSLSIFYLLRQTDGDRWLAFMGFPLFYGYVYYWGYIYFLFAIPIGILTLGWVYKTIAHFRWQDQMILFFMYVFLFFSHGLVFVLIVLVSLVLIIIKSTWSNIVSRAWPVWSLAPLVMIYAVLNRNDLYSPFYFAGPFFNLKRWVDFPFFLAGGFNSKPIDFILNPLILVLNMSTSLFRFRKSWLLWAPFLTLFLMYMLMPERWGLVHDFHARVVILVMVVGLLVIAPRQQAQNAIGFSWTVVPVILAMIFLSVRFSNFNRESRGINEMFKKMNASPYCLSLTVDKASDYVPGLVYFHFPIYGQLHKGGFFEFSFSTVFNQYIVSRKKDGSSHPLAELYCWRPELFNWQYSSAYDYYLVRARRDPVRLFKGAQGIKLMANQGNWWLYKNKTKSESLDLDGSERLIYR